MTDSSMEGIDLWLAHYQQISDPQLHENMRALLNDTERGKEMAFHFADDRLRYLVTRAMVRTVLSRYADIAAADWEFTLNEFGRPEIAPCHDVHDLHFNISHTRGLIALAVSRRGSLGVDVENVSEREAPIEIADRFFSRAEVADLESLPQACRHARFFEYWTFKESYIKARGMGLSLPLDRFSMHFQAGLATGFTADAQIDNDPQRWRFWQCRPTPNHLLALCIESPDGALPLVSVRQMVPTVDTMLMDVDVTDAYWACDLAST